MAEYIAFDLAGVTIDDLVEFEEGDSTKVKFIRDFLGRFVSDGNGGVLPEADGIAKIGSLKITQVQMLRERFQAEIEKVTSDSVDPTIENDSGAQ